MGWIEDIKNSIGDVAQGVGNNFAEVGSWFGKGPQLGQASSLWAPKPQAIQKPQGGGGFTGGGGSFGAPQETRAPITFGQDLMRKQSKSTPISGTIAEDPEDVYRSIIEELRAKIARDYEYDGAGDALVDQAFQGSLDALGSARTRTNDNYNTSRENIDTLTNSHVANIKGADRDAVNRIGDDLTSSYGSIYDSNEKSLQADRAAEIAAKTEMLNRLGIQDAGIGTVGDVQTEAIADNSAEKAGAMRQAEGYKAADLTRNVEQAQSMSNAGVERQTDLRRQLDGILGGLDTQESRIRNDMSTAKLGAQQADRANFQKEQGYYNDSLGTLLNDQSNREESARDFAYRQALDQAKLDSKGGESGGSNSMFGALDNQISAQGIDPAPYRAAYNQAMAEGGGPLSGDLGDKTSYLYKRIQEIMAKNGQQADLNVVGSYVNGIANYGTDKFNAR